MTRWIAFGAISAAVIGGTANGLHRAHTDERATAPPITRDVNGPGQEQEHTPDPYPASANDTLRITAEHEAGHVAAAREFLRTEDKEGVA